MTRWRITIVVCATLDALTVVSFRLSATDRTSAPMEKATCTSFFATGAGIGRP
jgi:hypothetical protein